MQTKFAHGPRTRSCVRQSQATHKFTIKYK